MKQYNGVRCTQVKQNVKGKTVEGSMMIFEDRIEIHKLMTSFFVILMIICVLVFTLIGISGGLIIGAFTFVIREWMLTAGICDEDATFIISMKGIHAVECKKSNIELHLGHGDQYIIQAGKKTEEILQMIKATS